MIHERPGVWSAFGAQGTTELTDRRLAAVIAPADAAEGVQLVHSAAEAVSLYGGNALLTRMLKLCLANCGDPVYAVAVDEDTKVAYETALTALFAAAKPGVLIVGSAREDVQLLLRETAEANECLGVAGMKGASADALVARAKALCCARIVLTGPDVLAQDEAVADGFCAAAAVGGAIASLSTPVVPLHDVALFGLQSLSALYTDDELDKLLQAGVTPVQLSGGRMCALRILTTRATAEGPEGESFRSLNTTLVTDELLRRIEDLSVPCVILGRSEEVGAEANWVDINNVQAGRRAVKLLLERGYKKIAFLSDGDGEVFNQDRIAGYRRELAANHLSVPDGFILHGLPTVESGMDCVRALLQGDDAPDAVICSDDRLALGALRAAHQLGLRVPEQFGIISCDNTPLTELAETPITSVDVDTFALGVQAAQILIEQIEDPQTSLRQILLSTKLIERASTMRETREETEAIHI